MKRLFRVLKDRFDLIELVLLLAMYAFAVFFFCRALPQFKEMYYALDVAPRLPWVTAMLVSGPALVLLPLVYIFIAAGMIAVHLKTNDAFRRRNVYSVAGLFLLVSVFLLAYALMSPLCGMIMGTR